MFRLRYIICIEESKQRLQDRMKQYNSAIQSGDQNHSGIFQHCLELCHGIDWKNTKIITSNQVYFKEKKCSEANIRAVILFLQIYSTQRMAPC